jgi:hypothetical protein
LDESSKISKRPNLKEQLFFLLKDHSKKRPANFEAMLFDQTTYLVIKATLSGRKRSFSV